MNIIPSEKYITRLLDDFCQEIPNEYVLGRVAITCENIEKEAEGKATLTDDQIRGIIKHWSTFDEAFSTEEKIKGRDLTNEEQDELCIKLLPALYSNKKKKVGVVPLTMDINYSDFEKLSHEEKREMLVKAFGGETPHVDILLNKMETSGPVASHSYEEMGVKNRQEALKSFLKTFGQ